jgi:signal transduction histidine kinase
MSWRGLIMIADAKQRQWMVAVVTTMVLGIGAIDFQLGFNISLLVFYCLPVCLAVSSLGWKAGSATAVLSVVVWLIGDLAAGAHYATAWILVWNAVIALITYLVVIWLFATMLALHREMGERVQQRTAALTEEIAQRKRLEREVLEIGERERRGIGHDLHDGLGQHLTATAMAAQVLGENLKAGTATVQEAKRIVQLIEQAIDQSRGLAKGLLLAEIEHDSLLALLHELAAATRDQFRVECIFTGTEMGALADNSSASHLYRITQEAVRNAVRHGKARRIEITLTSRSGETVLTVNDDGIGLTEARRRESAGMGLRIMAHRAAIIGAEFSIASPQFGGTSIVCRLSPT